MDCFLVSQETGLDPSTNEITSGGNLAQSESAYLTEERGLDA